jgi:hypothetical protein
MGGWTYRIRYVDLYGQPRSVERGPYATKNAAKDARNKKLNELRKSFGNIQTGEKMTFNELAEICKAEFYKPAVFSEGRKIAGVSPDASRRIFEE